MATGPQPELASQVPQVGLCVATCADVGLAKTSDDSAANQAPSSFGHALARTVCSQIQWPHDDACGDASLVRSALYDKELTSLFEFRQSVLFKPQRGVLLQSQADAQAAERREREKFQKNFPLGTQRL